MPNIVYDVEGLNKWYDIVKNYEKQKRAFDSTFNDYVEWYHTYPQIPVFTFDSITTAEPNKPIFSIGEDKDMSASTIRAEKLDFWLQHDLNVLFTGRHGVGKTSMIISCFERAGLVQGESFLYFSAPTLDPWVDFVGVPKEVKDEVTGTSYLELVRPRIFAGDKIVAIFLDEYNRSVPKIRNAVMELIQFKSINGKKFPNLKVVWAAVNPDEGDEYNVEKIDPAQEDRFHIKVEVPYKPNLMWFSNKYGKPLAKSAIEWWQELGADLQKLVSPRRLEYALTMYKLNGDIRDILPVSSNPSKLLKALQTEPVIDILEKFKTEKDSAGAYVFLQDENNYQSAIKHIIKETDMMHFFLPLVSKEHLNGLVASQKRVMGFVCQNESKYERFKEAIDEILKAGMNRNLEKELRAELASCKNKVPNFDPSPINTVDFEKIDLTNVRIGKDGRGGVLKDSGVPSGIENPW